MSGTPLHQKSSLADIETRFDNDVERFSNLDTGQAATLDAPLAMELITQAAVSATPQIRRVLDIGCGAGNNTLRLLEALPTGFDCHLNDLSEPMLLRAQARIAAATGSTTHLSGAISERSTLKKEVTMSSSQRPSSTICGMTTTGKVPSPKSTIYSDPGVRSGSPIL